jgi:hypothetical protein
VYILTYCSKPTTFIKFLQSNHFPEHFKTNYCNLTISQLYKDTKLLFYTTSGPQAEPASYLIVLQASSSQYSSHGVQLATHIHPLTTLSCAAVPPLHSVIYGIPRKGFKFTFKKLKCFEQQAAQFVN